MKKISYISYEAFFTADKTIVPILSSFYDVSFYFIQSTPSLVTADELLKLSNDSGAQVYTIKPKGRRRSLQQLPAYLKMINTIRSQNPDAIFIAPAHNIYLSLLAPLFLKKNKSVIAYHDVVPHLNETNVLKDFSQNIFKYLFKNFHFFSKTQMEIFKKEFSDKNCSYAPLIINEDHYQALQKKSSSGITHFLFFGSIKYYKGLDLLIQAGEKLYEEGITNLKIIIAGKGEHWDYCRTLIKNPAFYELMIRFVDESEVPDLFSRADFLVLPYRDVTQSGPLALSHSFNLPTIASDHVGFREHIINQHNGYIFKNEDVENLKNTMWTCITLTDEEYQQIKDNLAVYTNRIYDHQTVLQQYRAVFDVLS